MTDMTDTPTGTTATTGTTTDPWEPADDAGFAIGAFDACVEHRGPTADGPCAECGWLAGEHSAGLAAVIAVRPRPARVAPLRRAS